ncbi:hypothetical protein Galf_0935 [Gallionella capsiferriformans ES-2]|uniref:Uncharacterized protein n=1 Tax=Gallionella capsiferriformans (strain ES-2) TaxID=395494 RepID=D9SEJ1_GALCS|nr:hypothetical protein Galf_0935 [Gallionella capsiferriformans ES-2]
MTPDKNNPVSNFFCASISVSLNQSDIHPVGLSCALISCQLLLWFDFELKEVGVGLLTFTFFEWSSGFGRWTFMLTDFQLVICRFPTMLQTLRMQLVSIAAR